MLRPAPRNGLFFLWAGGQVLYDMTDSQQLVY